MKNKNKQWKIAHKISDTVIKKHPHYNEVVLQLLYNRGFVEDAEIETILNPDYQKYVFDPFLFNHMADAVEKIIEHIKKKNKIFIYGDYDADGVTSSALMFDILTILKAQVEVYIPDRVSEGYGVNKKAVDFINQNNGKLIITVDSGIRSKNEIDHAQELGIDVIVTDHHTPSEEKNTLPNCLIINPILENEKYPFKYLSGVGVAFKLASALVFKSNLDQSQKEKLEKRMLDLVAIGTIADCVVLLGENRVLVNEGLKILNNTSRTGLKELIKIAGLDGKKIASWNIGFQIAPRINAAGRMDHANTAFNLLIASHEMTAKKMATELNQRNLDRQVVAENIFQEVNEIVKDIEDKILIGVFELNHEKENEIWNEGIIGLVAGKICEKYYKPSLVVTKVVDGYKGSGRSIEEFNLIEAVSAVGDVLEKYGGHPMACGFSLTDKNIENFKSKIITLTNQKLKDVELLPKIKIETFLDLASISEDLYWQINKLEPFGYGNERPIFASAQVIIDDKIFMGSDNQHVKFKIKNNDTSVTAISFNSAERWKNINIGDVVDVAYYLDLNEFNGKKEIQIRIVDIK